jgi:hypothetical protein
MINLLPPFPNYANTTEAQFDIDAENWGDALPQFGQEVNSFIIQATNAQDETTKSNRVVGGDLSTNPWQYGETFLSQNNVSVMTADKVAVAGVDCGVVEITKSSTVPDVATSGKANKYTLKAEVVTAQASVFSHSYMQIQHRIEGINISDLGYGISGDLFTWFRLTMSSSVIGTYCISLRNADNTRHFIAEVFIPSPNVFIPVAIKIPVDSIGTWLIDEGVGIKLTVCLAAGTSLQATSNAWDTGNKIATNRQVNFIAQVGNTLHIADIGFGRQNIITWKSPQETLTDCEYYNLRTYPRGTATGTANTLTGAEYGVAASATTFQDGGVRRNKWMRGTGVSTTIYNPITGAANSIRNVTNNTDVAVSIVQQNGQMYQINGVGMTTGHLYAWHSVRTSELY